jgi:hypothetical protein
LEDREHEPFLPTRLWMRDPAAQDGELLAQHEQFEVLRARRPAGKEHEAKHLAEGERDEADSHRPSLAAESWLRRPGQAPECEVAPFRMSRYPLAVSSAAAAATSATSNSMLAWGTANSVVPKQALAASERGHSPKCFVPSSFWVNR